MIKFEDKTKEKCQDCSIFEPETNCTTFYGDNKIRQIVVNVYCANCDICDEIEQYLDGGKR